MKTRVSINFRIPRVEVPEHIPGDLAFLSKKVAKPPSFSVDPSLADRLVEWGKQEINGRSLIKDMAIMDEYEISDLGSQTVVEVFPTKLPRWVQNYLKAYTASWTCPFCMRVEKHQLDDYSIRQIAPTDFQMTEDDEWLISARVRPYIEGPGIGFRPIKNNDRFHQVLVEEKCAVRSDRPPVIAKDPCPECGRLQVVIRERYVEGHPEDKNYKGITLFREQPLTLAQLPPENIGFLRTSDDFGRFDGTPGMEPHPVGVAGSAGQYGYTQFSRFYFARAELVRQLLESGFTGLAFRPVKVEPE